MPSISADAVMYRTRPVWALWSLMWLIHLGARKTLVMGTILGGSLDFTKLALACIPLMAGRLSRFSLVVVDLRKDMGNTLALIGAKRLASRGYSAYLPHGVLLLEVAKDGRAQRGGVRDSGPTANERGLGSCRCWTRRSHRAEG